MNPAVQHATNQMVERNNAHIVANNHSGMDQEYVEQQKWAISEGRRYLKGTAGGSVSIFIDKNTGEIFKPATYAMPAKGVRGNVLSDQNGDEALDFVNNMMLVFVRYARG